MEELFNQIKERYLALSEDDKIVIRSLMGTEQGRVLAKVLGADLVSQINLRKPTSSVKKRGLATR